MSLETFKPHIFIHGYDYIRSAPGKRNIKKGWANKYMIKAGIKESSDRKKVIIYLVDQFNEMLIELTNTQPVDFEKRLKQLIRYPHGCT